MFFKNDKDKAAEKVKEGQELFKQRHVEDGLKLLREAIKLDPNNADAWGLIGSGEQSLMNNLGAIEAFQKLTTLNPNNHEAWARQAACLVELNRFDEAHHAIQSSLAIFQKQNQPIPAPYQAVARGVGVLKARHNAENEFKQAPQTAVKLATLPEVMAKIEGFQSSFQANPAETMNNLDTLLKEHANVPELFLWHGNIVKSMGYMDWAVKDYTRAICLAPDFVQPYIERSTIWTAVGRFADIFSDTDKVLSLDPNNIEAIALRAEAFTLKGDGLSAAQENAKLLALDLSQHPNPRMLLKQGDILFRAKRFDEALKTFNILLARPNLGNDLNAQAHHYQSKVFLNTNRKSDAVDSALKAVELMPMNADYCHGLGESAKQAGRKQEEIRGWEAYIAALKGGAQGFLPLYVAENFLRDAQAK